MDYFHSHNNVNLQDAQFVSFTPEGQLLSYKSNSCSITIWPHVNTIWCDGELKTDSLVIDNVQEIQR